jgi:type IV pilus assembly protein PilB
LLSSSLIGVIAQRLVRTICQECKTSYVAEPDEINKYGWHDKGQVRLFKGRGCPVCYDSGYKGRIATHEILTVGSSLQKLMITSPSQDELAAYVKNAGMKTLFDDGMDRVLQGKTTVEEVARVVSYE